ncbi:MAG: dTDP-4-dehydrorhamnose reductase [Burkholderiaceae bacterium]
MTILLFGGQGKLGWELRRALAPLGEVIAPGRGEADGAWGDLARPQALAAMVRALRPRWVVNAAAYTAVDRAESEPEQACLVNVTAVAAMAQAAADAGSTLVHYSTDYVFDGRAGAPYDEDAIPAPINVYGRSKLAGEAAIRARGCRHLILRTGGVYAARGESFVRSVLRLAAVRDSIEVVADQLGAPTGAELIADVTAHAVRALAQRPALGGTYHLSAAGAVSRCDLARFVVATALAQGAALRLTPPAITPIASAAYPAPAARPLDARLDSRRLEAAFDLVLPPWQAGVERVIAEWIEFGVVPRKGAA